MSRFSPVVLLLVSLMGGSVSRAQADTLTEHWRQAAPLSAAEWQACVMQREHIARAEDRLEVQRGGLEQTRTEVERLSEALDVQLGTLDPERPAEVQAFHGQMLERDRRAIDLADRLSAFHARVEAVKAEAAGWTARCAGRSYDATGEPQGAPQGR